MAYPTQTVYPCEVVLQVSSSNQPTMVLRDPAYKGISWPNPQYPPRGRASLKGVLLTLLTSQLGQAKNEGFIYIFTVTFVLLYFLSLLQTFFFNGALLGKTL